MSLATCYDCRTTYDSDTEHCACGGFCDDCGEVVVVLVGCEHCGMERCSACVARDTVEGYDDHDCARSGDCDEVPHG